MNRYLRAVRDGTIAGTLVGYLLYDVKSYSFFPIENFWLPAFVGSIMMCVIFLPIEWAFARAELAYKLPTEPKGRGRKGGGPRGPRRDLSDGDAPA